MRARVTILLPMLALLAGCGEDGENDDEKIEYCRIREIVIHYRGARGADPATDRTADQARALAEELLKEAKKEGASFPELAFDRSDDGSWRQGGERQQFSDEDFGEIPEAVAKAALSLDEKEIAGPIEAPDGFHVVKRLPLAGDNEGDHLRPNPDLAHILVSHRDAPRAPEKVARSKEEARDRAARAHLEATEGKIPWSVLVETYSDDPASRERKGRLLRYRRRSGAYSDLFDRVVRHLGPAETAEGIVETDWGFHVLRRLTREENLGEGEE